MSEHGIELVSNEMANTRYFNLVGVTNAPIKLCFSEFKVDENELGISTWEISLSKNNTFQIILRSASAIDCTLTLSRGPVWSGRYTKTGNYVELRPLDNIENWNKFIKPSFLANKIKETNDPRTFKYIEDVPTPLDTSQFKFDITKQVSVDRVSYSNSRTAIAVIGADRPDYFKQTIKSLSECDGIERFPVFIFLDKSTSHDADRMQQEHVDIANYYLPQATLICRRVNFGCGRNIIDARRQLFDKMCYDRVFVFEDDMILSSGYLLFCIALLEWGEQNYGNIGAVQGWNKCMFSPQGKADYLDHVYPTATNWWGYLMTQRAWQSIREFVYEFERLFLRWNYNMRPHRSVLKWFQGKTKNPKTRQGFYPVGDPYIKAMEKYLNSPPSGQDAATMIGMHREGLARLAPFVNRSSYIGKLGIHMNPSWFSRDGYDKVFFEEYPSDKKIKSFVCGDYKEEDIETDEIVPGMQHIVI